jgi:hypothetical protein
MNMPADQPKRLSDLRQRAAKAGARVHALVDELKAEREMRDAALVELYDGRRLFGLSVDEVAHAGGISRATLLGIVANA